MALIELRDVTKIYDAGDVQVKALAGVSLDVEAGESIAIMGASGSGKSTLMNLLGCLDRPTSGSYRLAGEDVGRLDRNRLAEIRNRTLGFVFQSFNLLARTSAVENVELPLLYSGVAPSDRRRRALVALERVGLAERAGHHPNQLSGGQQQRVAIARALVVEPRIILADEPTANLDSATGANIIDLMRDMNRRDGTTFVFSTHDPKVMAHANAIVRIADGRIEGREAAAAAGGR